MDDTLVSGRITYGSRCTGTAQAAYDLSVEYAKTGSVRQAHHQFQATKFKLAEMAMNIDIMRSYTHRVAALYDMGKQ